VRDFILAHSATFIEKLSIGQRIEVADPVLALDFIFILKGALKIVLEPTATKQTINGNFTE
jgi:hypothetical protein